MKRPVTLVLSMSIIFVQFVLVAPAYAASISCRDPFKPQGPSNVIEYEGNASCTGTNVDTWRAKVGLAQENVRVGPIPNTWPTVAGSYTGYTRWAARGTILNKGGWLYCSEVRRNWDFKSKFWYHVDCRCGGLEEFGEFSTEATDQCTQ